MNNNIFYQRFSYFVILPFLYLSLLCLVIPYKINLFALYFTVLVITLTSQPTTFSLQFIIVRGFLVLLTQGSVLPFLGYQVVLNLLEKYFFKIFFPVPESAGILTSKKLILFSKKVLINNGIPPQAATRIASGGALLWSANHLSYKKKLLPLQIRDNELSSQIDRWKEIYFQSSTPEHQVEAFTQIKTLSKEKLELSSRIGETHGAVTEFVIFGSEQAKLIILNS